MLRHLGATNATIWMEISGPCEVAILGQREHTFHVAGHHYALVVLRDLEPGREYPLTVELDGATVWPEADTELPPSVIQTVQPASPELRLAFGSCRATAPHGPPYSLTRDEHPLGRGPDALRALALRLTNEAPATWPRALVLVGDQVYADEVSPRTRAFIRARRDTRRAPGEEVANFEEYAHLYQEAWQDPVVRWLLANIATTMMWDDHDVHDDWNISRVWLQDRRALPWWRERMVGAYMAYWLYQHLGNLSPRELDADELLARLRCAEDGEPILREFAEREVLQPDARRWSVCRDFGRTRLLAIDCRAGRVLDTGKRSMLDGPTWRWIEEQARGDFDHLLIALSVPYLLAPGIHHLEAWSESVCNGAWGERFAHLGERIRRGLDLDHWAAFQHSFNRLAELLRQVACGKLGVAPSTIVVLSGDVHNCYLAEASFPGSPGPVSRVYQAVCSPLRNRLGRWDRRALGLVGSRPIEWLARRAAAAAGVPPPRLRWRYLAQPSFLNQVGTLEFRGRQAGIRVEQAVQQADQAPSLETVFARRLA